MKHEEVKEVKELTDVRTVNTCLKEGWILLDARVVQLSHESLEKNKGYYILGKEEEEKYPKYEEKC